MSRSIKFTGDYPQLPISDSALNGDARCTGLDVCQAFGVESPIYAAIIKQVFFIFFTTTIGLWDNYVEK